MMEHQLGLLPAPGETTADTPPELFAGLDWDRPCGSFPVLDDDLDALYRVRQDWWQKLTILRCAPGTSAASPTEAQIAAFTHYLVAIQRHDTEPDMRVGSWAIPLDVRMESDARVDFVYFPTYIAVAWLSLVRQDHPHVARRIRGLDRALRRGLRFAGYRKLAGHGYDRHRECLEAVRLLALGKVFTLVRQEPTLSLSFQRVLGDVEYTILHDMPNASDWSQTDVAEREYALTLLRGGDANDARVSAPVHDTWMAQQGQWYLGRIGAAALPVLARDAGAAIAEELSARQAEFRDDFEAVRPTVTVFRRQRRVVRTPSRELQTRVAIRAALQTATATVPVPEWLRPLPDRRIEQALRSSLQRRLPAAIAEALWTQCVFAEEAFRPYVDTVELEDDGHLTLAVGVQG